MCQKLPADFQPMVVSFCEFVVKQETEHVSPDHIINMDKIPLTFDNL